MTIDYLLKRISDTSITAEERLEALCEIRRLVDFGKIKRPEKTVFVNNHIHTCYSFSPYTPASAVYYAWQAGLQTAGIMDHDSVSGFREFIIAGRIMDMPVTCGFECRVNVNGTSLVGKKINNPDQVSCAYVAMHGVPHQNTDKVEAVLRNMRYLRNVRNRKMIDNINALVADYGIRIDFDSDVYPLSMARLGGRVTERHVCMALTKKITERYPERAEALDFVDQLCGSKMSEKTREKLLTAPDNFYEYDILGVLKGHLVGRFYVDATDECMNIIEFTNLCKEGRRHISLRIPRRCRGISDGRQEGAEVRGRLYRRAVRSAEGVRVQRGHVHAVEEHEGTASASHKDVQRERPVPDLGRGHQFPETEFHLPGTGRPCIRAPEDIHIRPDRPRAGSYHEHRGCDVLRKDICPVP